MGRELVWVLHSMGEIGILLFRDGLGLDVDCRWELTDRLEIPLDTACGWRLSCSAIIGNIA